MNARETKGARQAPRRAGVRLLLTAVIVTMVGLTTPSAADVSAVQGSAFGARGSVSLFGGPPFVLNPTPQVTLPPTGGNVTDSVQSIQFQVGPARLLETGPANVSSIGTVGPTGSVTSTATVQNVRLGGTTITTLNATCTASETARTGSTTVTGGRIPVSDPNPDVEGDEVFQNIPVNPPPGTTIRGVVPGVGDQYDAIFNEQTVTGTSITVTGVHFRLLGPSAVGDVFVGQVQCGVTVVPGTTTTTTAPTTTTTAPTTTTTAPTTTTTAPTTTTTAPTTTTTTAPTTTTTGPTTTTTGPTTTTTGPTTTTRPPTTTTTAPAPTTTTTFVPGTTTTTRPSPTCNPPTGQISGFIFNVIAPRLPAFVRPLVEAVAIRFCLRGL